jgi:cytochrome P450
VTELIRRFGDIVRFRMGPRVYHLVNHPDYIGHVLRDRQQNYQKGIGLMQAKAILGNGLLTSDGDLWLHQRRLMQPAFHSQRIAELTPIITKVVSSFLDRWEGARTSGAPLDVSAEMTRLTLRVLGETLFRMDVAERADEVADAFAVVADDAIRRMAAIVPWPRSLPTSRNLRLRRAHRTLDTFVAGIIEHRRRESREGGDLLSRLMVEGGPRGSSIMTDRQLRDELMTMLLAGHETTASALTWTWYLLSRYPHAEREVSLEVARVLAGRLPAFEDCARLTFTRMVIEESLRLYPPVWLIPRQAVSDDAIGGFRIPAGSGVLISPFAVHRHPIFWDNPEGFDPDRFAPGRAERRPAYAYLPFGAGHRSCIGSGFGMLESQLVVAMTVQRYRLDLVAGASVEPEAVLTLRPRAGLPMTVHLS